MECIFCKRIFESEEEKEARDLEEEKKRKTKDFEGIKKTIIAEIEKFEQSNREKEANNSRKGLEKINKKIEQLSSKKIIIADKLCSKCETIIGKIIEDKLDDRMEEIVENITDLISSELD